MHVEQFFFNDKYKGFRSIESTELLEQPHDDRESTHSEFDVVAGGSRIVAETGDGPDSSIANSVDRLKLKTMWRDRRSDAVDERVSGI